MKAGADKYVLTLRDILGPPDPRFTFRSVDESPDEYPRTFFPAPWYYDPQGCKVYIHIGRSAWRSGNFAFAAWQLAHECVHLLDPGTPPTNMLEEGLATWFQFTPQFHDPDMHQFIDSNSKLVRGEYAEAKALTASAVLVGLLPAVKEIRAAGVRISDIAPRDLTSRLPPGMEPTAERLCGAFDYGEA